MRSARPRRSRRTARRQHVDERVDEVAEARLHHVVVDDRPDVEQPVEADQRAAPREAEDGAGAGRDGTPVRPAPAQRHPDRHRDEPPDHAVGHDLEGGHRREQLPVEGEEPPHQEGGHGREEAGAGGDPGLHRAHLRRDPDARHRSRPRLRYDGWAPHALRQHPLAAHPVARALPARRSRPSSRHGRLLTRAVLVRAPEADESTSSTGRSSSSAPSSAPPRRATPRDAPWGPCAASSRRSSRSCASPA
jgi:hypothetical protein